MPFAVFYKIQIPGLISGDLYFILLNFSIKKSYPEHFYNTISNSLQIWLCKIAS